MDDIRMGEIGTPPGGDSGMNHALQLDKISAPAVTRAAVEASVAERLGIAELVPYSANLIVRHTMGINLPPKMPVSAVPDREVQPRNYDSWLPRLQQRVSYAAVLLGELTVGKTPVKDVKISYLTSNQKLLEAGPQTDVSAAKRPAAAPKTTTPPRTTAPQRGGRGRSFKGKPGGGRRSGQPAIPSRRTNGGTWSGNERSWRH